MRFKKFISIVIAIACMLSCGITAGAVTYGNSADYDTIWDFVEGYAAVLKGEKVGFIDEDGNEAVPVIYDNCNYFTEGYAKVCINDKWGFVDTKGNVVVDIIYDVVGDFSEGYAVVQLNGKFGFVDTEGNVEVDIIYDDVLYFCEGYAGVMLDDKFGFVDTEGNVVVDIIYDYVWDFSEGYAIVQLNGKLGYVDTDGNVVVDIIYDCLWDFSEGFACVELDSKLGFVDTEGNVIVDIIYEDFWDYSDGYAAIKLDGKWGIVDTEGTIVVALTYTSYFDAYDELDTYKANLPEAEEVVTETVVNDAKTAVPTDAAILVDGEATSFDAYEIDDNNYFKLRDVAYILSGTDASFEITWNEEAQAIDMISGQDYTAVGGEMAIGDGTNQTAETSTATIYLNGVEVSLTAYEINDNNYFKLRDLGEALGFNVSWDGDANSIVVASNEAYTAD